LRKQTPGTRSITSELGCGAGFQNWIILKVFVLADIGMVVGKDEHNDTDSEDDGIKTNHGEETHVMKADGPFSNWVSVGSSPGRGGLDSAGSDRLSQWLNARAFSPSDSLEGVTPEDLCWAKSRLGLRASQAMRAVQTYTKHIDVENGFPARKLAGVPEVKQLAFAVRRALSAREGAETGRPTADDSDVNDGNVVEPFDFPSTGVLRAVARRANVGCETLFQCVLLHLSVLHALGLQDPKDTADGVAFDEEMLRPPVDAEGAAEAVRSGRRGPFHRRNRKKGPSTFGDATRMRAKDVLTVLQTVSNCNALFGLLAQEKFDEVAALLRAAEDSPELAADVAAMCASAVRVGTRYILPVHAVLENSSLPVHERARLAADILSKFPDAIAARYLQVQRFFESTSLSLALRGCAWQRVDSLSEMESANSLAVVALVLEVHPTGVHEPVLNSRDGFYHCVDVWREAADAWIASKSAQSVISEDDLENIRGSWTILWNESPQITSEAPKARLPPCWIAALLELLLLVQKYGNAGTTPEFLPRFLPDIDAIERACGSSGETWTLICSTVERATEAAKALADSRGLPRLTTLPPDRDSAILPPWSVTNVGRGARAALENLATRGVEDKSIPVRVAAALLTLRDDVLNALLAWTRVGEFSLCRPTQAGVVRDLAAAAERFVEAQLESVAEFALSEDSQREFHRQEKLEPASADQSSVGQRDVVSLLAEYVDPDFRPIRSKTPDQYFLKPLVIPHLSMEGFRWLDVKQVMVIDRDRPEYRNDSKQFAGYVKQYGPGLVLWLPMVSRHCERLHGGSVCHATIAQPEHPNQGYGALLDHDTLALNDSRLETAVSAIEADLVSENICRTGRACNLRECPCEHLWLSAPTLDEEVRERDTSRLLADLASESTGI
jgi:hypothetical protein